MRAIFNVIPNFFPFFSPGKGTFANYAYFLRKILFFNVLGHQRFPSSIFLKILEALDMIAFFLELSNLSHVAYIKERRGFFANDSR